MNEAEAVIESIGTWIVIGGGIGAAVAHFKGRDVGYGFLLGMLLGPMSFILYYRMADAPDPGVRKCPFCAEFVKAEARVCRHCTRPLPALRKPDRGIRHLNGRPIRRRQT